MSHSPNEMLPPNEPLQRLPQQPLINPTGARLVLRNNDTGYPGHTDPGRGRWFDKIANTDTTTFLQAINDISDCAPDPSGWVLWVWPAVVLTPEEYKLRVGGMSVTELRSQLEKYWGRGGIPGAAADDDYQDMWVPAWAPENTDDPYDLSWDPEEEPTRLDPTIFSHWVNGECSPWLSYFIAKNHTFGVVHAWFSAFLGVTRECIYDIARFLIGDSGTLHLKFRMSFDLCIEDYDEVVDGLPSLPFNTKITTNKRGMQVINNRIEEMSPRRVWDICANTVIPATWFFGPPCPLPGFPHIPVGVKPISHAWVADGDLTYIMTEANQGMWPIPVPRGVQLEDIRGEMIRLGVRYAWLDVLCLRQQFRPRLAKSRIPVIRKITKSHDLRRFEEWEVDVPTIGAIYSDLGKLTIYRGGPIVIFMRGLGRPFRDEGWASERHWLRRAWTIQETPPLSHCLIAGLPGGVNYGWKNDINGSPWPWNCKVCNVLSQIYNIHITYPMSLTAEVAATYYW